MYHFSNFRYQGSFVNVSVYISVYQIFEVSNIYHLADNWSRKKFIQRKLM